jgi:hypothetical protein
MPRRVLGRTGLEVGVVGLGTEHLLDRETTVSTVHEALDRGVNYFDTLMPMPGYRDNMGAAFAGRRDRAVLTCHLGGTLKDGQWSLSREPSVCEDYFNDWLRRLRTDHADVAIITCVDKVDDFEKFMGPGGVMDLAQKLKREGKTRAIGMSGHEPDVAMRAVESGLFDLLVQGCNVTWPVDQVGRACAKAEMGLVAMKPYAGGELFHPPYSGFLTPVLAISHVLAQPGVCTVIPGAANLAQLRQALEYVDATEEQRDWRPIADRFTDLVRGTCIYCNHCLPCPAGIPIGNVLQALRSLTLGMAYGPDMARTWADQPEKCTGCGECLDRCPFGVQVPEAMARAVETFAPFRRG